MKITGILITFLLMISTIAPMEASSVSDDNTQNTSLVDSGENVNSTEVDLDKLTIELNALNRHKQPKEVADTPQKELIGEFRLSFYTPSPDETDDSPFITASGTRVKPGVTVAVDTRYWEFGTKFYIEGHGYVVAEDTGSMIKGPNVMDVSVATKDQAFKNGIQYRKVWVVKA